MQQYLVCDVGNFILRTQILNGICSKTSYNVDSVKHQSINVFYLLINWYCTCKCQYFGSCDHCQISSYLLYSFVCAFFSKMCLFSLGAIYSCNSFLKKIKINKIPHSRNSSKSNRKIIQEVKYIPLTHQCMIQVIVFCNLKGRMG